MARNYKEEWEEVRKKLITYTNDTTINYQYGTIKKDNRTKITTKIKDNKTENTTKDDWDKAIKIFQDRLYSYFFKPILEIITMEYQQGEGFAAVTLECSLIEMLQAFKEGKIFKHDNPDSSKYEYKDSGEMFKRFLKDANISSSLTRNEDLRTRFYSEVRCGLMHVARTNGDWTINIVSEECCCEEKSKEDTLRADLNRYKNIYEDSNPLLEEKEGGEAIENTFTGRDFIEEVIIDSINKKKVYRTILFFKLIKYVKEYCKDLKEENENGKELRRNFARCMDHLFDFKPADGEEWWNSN